MTNNELYECDKLIDRAQVALSSRQYVEAASLIRDALNKREQLIGEDIIGGELMDRLGQILMKLSKPKEAEDWFKKAIECIERCTYAGHYQLAPVLEHLADLYVFQDDYEAAEPVAKRALDIFDKTVSGEHRSIFEMMHKLVLIYRKLEKYADAETMINKALKNIDTPLGPAEEFRYQLALVYLAQNKSAEAQKALEQAIAGFEQRHNYPRLIEALGHYVEALKKDNKKDEAKATQDYLERVKVATRHVRPNSEDIFPATLLRA